MENKYEIVRETLTLENGIMVNWKKEKQLANTPMLFEQVVNGWKKRKNCVFNLKDIPNGQFAFCVYPVNGRLKKNKISYRNI